MTRGARALSRARQRVFELQCDGKGSIACRRGSRRPAETLTLSFSLSLRVLKSNSYSFTPKTAPPAFDSLRANIGQRSSFWWISSRCSSQRSPISSMGSSAPTGAGVPPLCSAGRAVKFAVGARRSTGCRVARWCYFTGTPQKGPDLSLRRGGPLTTGELTRKRRSVAQG